MKKYVAVVLLFAIMFSLTACRDLSFNKTPTENTYAEETAVEKTTVEETTAEETTSDESPANEPQSESDDTEQPEYAGDNRDIEYTGDWVDKNLWDTDENFFNDTLRITAIYSNCFFATPVTAIPYVYKINGTLSEEWCVDDYCVCDLENVYLDEVNYRYEGDLLEIEISDGEPNPNTAAKPVIYLYPETETDVSVNLTLEGKLNCTYPAYNNGWKVTASPDGTLTDTKGQTYNYLYWEGETNVEYDFSEGFCVKGEDTAAFLEKALEHLGLTRREANEFIVYWLPLMEQNEYNIISFQGDIYNNAAQLLVTPTPDTLIRVFMAWHKADTFVNIPEQKLTSPDRNGFTVVEWGGTQLE